MFGKLRKTKQSALILLNIFLIAASSNSFGQLFSEAARSASQYSQANYAARQSCESLVEQSNYKFTIITARIVEQHEKIPTHCRIDGLIPTEIRFELNLPLNWNGRIYIYGNGGLAGTPAVDPGKQYARNQALGQAFATAYTDTGHDKRVTPGGTFAHNNFHRLVDYGFRLV